MVGTADEVARMLAEYRDRHLTHLSLNFHQPGQDSGAVRRSVQLFADKLMPAITQW